MKTKDIIKKVQWKDLKRLTLKETIIENTITLPWLIASLTLAYHKIYWLAIPCSGFFFLTGLRQVHNGFHNALGTNKHLTWLTLYVNSIIMHVSIHAVKFNHLRHHKYCLKEEDQEGKSAFMKWYEAVLYGPVHMFKIHQITWKLGGKSYRYQMILELLSVCSMIGISFYFQIHWLIYHSVVMIIGEFLMSFFAVWTVHHDTTDNPLIARTQRTKWKNLISYNMFYHMEHHIFPAVPTIKLPELARRIDQSFPQLKKKQTF